MTLQEKIDILHRAGFPIRYADRMPERCPQYVSWSDVQDRPYSYHGCTVRAYVDLSAIGKGDDSYGQSSTLDRSNYRRLREDYPDTFTDTSYVNVDSLGAYVGNLSDEVIEILTRLREQYPAYDDSDMSELESEEITESWEQYVSSDLWREMYERYGEPFSDAWDGLTADKQRDMFWSAVDTTDSYPEHDGYDVLWRYDTISQKLASELGLSS